MVISTRIPVSQYTESIRITELFTVGWNSVTSGLTSCFELAELSPVLGQLLRALNPPTMKTAQALWVLSHVRPSSVIFLSLQLDISLIYGSCLLLSCCALLQLLSACLTSRGRMLVDPLMMSLILAQSAQLPHLLTGQVLQHWPS